mgnify:CR=1 FL=1
MSDISTFADQVVLVTGSSRGIGAALAAGFAQHGARVIINHLEDAAQAAKTAAQIEEQGGEVLVIEADVADGEQVAAMVARVLEQWGQIDVLVCNAGICPFYDFLTMPEAVWDRVLDVNLKGVFLTGQAVARHMVERRGGRIVAISSISSLVGGMQQAHYCASKAGINLPAVGQIEVPLPPRDEQDAIVERLDAADEEVARYRVEHAKLSSLREGLRHDLLTGRKPVVAIREAAE